MTSYTLDVTSISPLSKNKPRQAIVLCHGYGGDGKDISVLAINWQRFLPDAIFLCPNAPEVCEVNPKGFQWFNLDSENEDTVLENCANEYIGSVSDKIEGSVKIINAMYSTNYEAYIYTGIYEGKFLVNFWNGKELAKKDETINIKAKIKRLGLSKFYNGAWETSLNYVRKVDNKKELTKEKAFDAIVEGLKIISGDK